MRILALVTDAFGGRGGIAKFNRDMLRALCGHPDCVEVVALPRVMSDAPEALPARLTFRTDGLSGKVRYTQAVLRSLGGSRYDLVVCGHINLLPLASLAARRLRAPLLLVVHGIDAWQPTGRPLTDRLAARVDAFVAVSEFTKRHFLAWTGLPPERGHVVPNCVELSQYGPGPKPEYLLDRYGLRGREVILTVARLASKERYKGHDQVMAVLPELATTHPNLSYLIVGDGDDRSRLAARAAWLGVGDRVVFAGHVPEAEKADHYRVADAFVMPGRKEGFGIVYLEALACGVPVVASTADASREAVLDGRLGVLADPDDPMTVVRAISATLRTGRGSAPRELAFFSAARFDARWQPVVDATLHRALVDGGRRSPALL